MVHCVAGHGRYDEGHFVAPVLDKYGGAEKLEAIKRAIDGFDASLP